MAIVMVVSIWKIFEKAGRPGWAAIVPVYNHMVMAEIGGKPNWFGLLPMIPYIGSIWSIWILNRLVKSFNKEVGFTLGLIYVGIVARGQTFGNKIFFKKRISFIGKY
jgi:hypothetical protein